MRTYECPCGATLFFQNVHCVACGRTAGWCDSCRRVTTLSDEGRCENPDCGQPLRECENRAKYAVCNSLIVEQPAGSSLCRSCQMTTHLPDLTNEQNVARWGRMELAKRRLLYDFQTVGYPDQRLTCDPPLTFQFLEDTPDEHVTTGHADGVITINLAEADPVEREISRQEFGEPQRTLIGHMRHESGHFFWMREIEGQREADSIAVFGDHNAPPYADAMPQYYEQGPPPNWKEHFISRYASSHPWEDFAETYAFYLDMRAVLDTLAEHLPEYKQTDERDLTEMLKHFQDAGLMLNEINRTVGLTDLLPEVVPPPVTAKLQFVHDLFQAAA